MNIVYLAAGKSSRIFKDIKKPKCMISLNNETLIENLIKKAPRGISRYVVTGFKSYAIKEYFKSKKFKNVKFLYNKYYSSREMLYSLLFAMNKIKGDIIYSYSDISYQKKIIHKLIKKKKYITVPILNNWKQVWNKRKKKITDDAEELLVDEKKKIILKIGTKIKNKIPKYQFMGLVYFPSNIKKKLLNFIKEIISENFKPQHFYKN